MECKGQCRSNRSNSGVTAAQTRFRITKSGHQRKGTIFLAYPCQGLNQQEGHHLSRPLIRVFVFWTLRSQKGNNSLWDILILRPHFPSSLGWFQRECDAGFLRGQEPPTKKARTFPMPVGRLPPSRPELEPRDALRGAGCCFKFSVGGWCCCFWAVATMETFLGAPVWKAA